MLQGHMFQLLINNSASLKGGWVPETKAIPLLAASPIAGNLVLTDLQPWQITHSLISIIISSDHTQLYPKIIIANYGDSCLFCFDYFKFSSSFACFSANSGYKLRQV